MTNNVKMFPGNNMPTKLGEPNAALISVLEDALERAKTGQLQSLIATGHTSDNARYAVWADFNEDVYQTLGSINWLEHEYVARHTKEIV